MASMSETKPKRRVKRKCPIHGCYAPLKKIWVPTATLEFECVACTKCNWGGLTTGRTRNKAA